MYRYLSFILFTLFFAQINGQDTSYLFVKTNPDIGNRAITCMTTDSNNHLWIGTYGGGLKRYDGLNVETYNHDPFSKSSISNSTVFDLMFSKNQGLWIATQNGINHFNPNTKSFSLFKPISETISVHALCETDNDILVVGTHQKGIYFFNTVDKTFHKISIPESIDENGLLINDIVVDQLSRIWVGSNYGVFIIDKNTRVLSKVSFRDLKTKSPNNTDVLSLENDHFGNIWIGTAEDGLFKILPGGVNSFGVEHYKISNKRIFSIKEYDNRYMLLGSENDGFFVISYDGKVLKRYIKEKESQFGIHSNSIWSIHSDSSNRIWLGFYDQGLVKFDPIHFKFKFLENNSRSKTQPFPISVSSIIKDNNDRIWFSSVDNGVYVYDSFQKEYTHLNDSKNKIANGLNSLDITSLFIDSRQNIWVASWYDGLYFLRNGTKNFININTNSTPYKLKSNRVVSFSEDTKGIIWIGTFEGGLYSFDINTDKLIHYDDQQFIDFELEKGNIRKVTTDSYDNVWLGTRKGLFRYNPKTKVITSINEKIKSTIKNFGSNFIVFSIYEDTNNTIWIGTDGYGLLSFSPNEDKIIWHGEGKEIRNMSINAITQTYDGSFWLGTDNGLIRYDIDTDDYRVYDRSDGLLNNTVNKSSFYNEQSTLYFGTIGGINFFNPIDIPKNESLPKVTFQKLKISNNEVGVSKNSPLKKALNQLDTLILKHNQSSFSIFYMGVSHTRSEKNSYAYMLDGLDEDWNYVGQQQTANYTNIKPGDYTFRLKAANNDGYWTNEPKTIFIKVLSPWWLSWWAKILYITIFISLGYYIYRLIILRISEKRKAELERGQRKQNEELNTKKIQFFTNISHEFRTPLTLILNPLESLIKDKHINNLPSEIIDKHKIIHRNTIRLKRLIDELMDFRKMEFSELKVQIQEVDLVEIMTNITSNFIEEANFRNIDFQIDFEESLPKQIMVDTSMFDKILFNLLSNAFKATMENGKIRVKVTHHNQGLVFPLIDENNAQSGFEFDITDTGIGINKKNLKNIFDRFYQGEDNNELYYSGTGIGLEVVKKFVDYHKGKIVVKSEQGVGTSFKIFIPDTKIQFYENKQIINDKKLSQLQSKNLSGSADEQSFENIKLSERNTILIVEDNMELREYLKFELKSLYKVLEAPNGKNGLEIARKNRPDVIIADVMMPEMDGFQMTRLLKSEKSTMNIPIVILTAKVGESDRIHGIDLGADIYLKKPFSIDLLKTHLLQLIKSKERLYETYFNSLDLEINATGGNKKILADVIHVINENLSKEDLCVQDIADELALSRSKLYRKIKELTGKSANEMIRKMRLEKSKELLEITDMTIGEICYKVGFSSPSYYTKRFKEYTGLIPKEYRLLNKKKKELLIEK
jgi:signal transduction histidine kinase/ligand-binding sensor domain-containing protein/response regulator RpfG family c-di-GMP phosphodiesterase